MARIGPVGIAIVVMAAPRANSRWRGRVMMAAQIGSLSMRQRILTRMVMVPATAQQGMGQQ